MGFLDKINNVLAPEPSPVTMALCIRHLSTCVDALATVVALDGARDGEREVLDEIKKSCRQVQAALEDLP